MDSSWVCCLEPYLALRPHTSVCLNHFKLMFPKCWWSDWGNSFVSRPLMGDQRLFPLSCCAPMFCIWFTSCLKKGCQVKLGILNRKETISAERTAKLFYLRQNPWKSRCHLQCAVADYFLCVCVPDWELSPRSLWYFWRWVRFFGRLLS